jgi:hypothetical protein
VRDRFRVGSFTFVRSDKRLYKLRWNHHDLNPSVTEPLAPINGLSHKPQTLPSLALDS